MEGKVDERVYPLMDWRKIISGETENPWITGIDARLAELLDVIPFGNASVGTHCNGSDDGA